MDYYLKFKDEAEANSVLFDGETPRFANVDIIGTIYTPTNEVDADGYPVMAAVDGWHVNVRSAEEQEWLDVYNTNPNTPYRIWA